MIRFLTILLLASQCSAAVYYVRKDGTDGAGVAGTATNTAWLTVGYAESRMSAGDTVYVAAGTYEEGPTIDVDGNSGEWINFVGETNAIVREWIFSSANYVRLVGFELTHADTSWGGRPIQIQGTSAHIEIVDMNIHDVHAGESEPVVYSSPGADVSYVTIRGCSIYSVNTVGATTHAASYGITAPTTAHHYLVEYTRISRVGDYMNLYGQNHIIRNCVLTDHDDSYWNTADPEHSDFMQPGSDGQQNYCRHHLIENCWGGDNRCMGGSQNDQNGHWIILQDTTSSGDTNVLKRGCVGYHINNGAFAVIGTDYARAHNNSYYDLDCDTGSDRPFVWYSQAAVGGLLGNIIISGIGTATAAISVEVGTVTTTHNLGYNAGSHASFVSTSNPLYTDPTAPARNFRLGSASPARGAGTALATITSASGSGTSFTVSDPLLFSDGWGMVEGDRVVVNGTTARITDNDWDTSTFTVSASVTWTQNDPIYWDNNQLDIGALPYGSTELTAATISTNGTIYTVTPTGDARGVWFYADGIPSYWDYDAPFTFTNAGVVTAKAYALYAQSTPVVLAQGGAILAAGTVRTGTAGRLRVGF